jgi:integrase
VTAASARQLLDSIESNTLIGLRDRALIGVMVYSFARVGAAVAMNGGDLFSIANGSGCGCTRKAASATK